jgi:EAL domain-containing protein (putative c-di-GMP-specific phosphodiesterase class I)
MICILTNNLTLNAQLKRDLDALGISSQVLAATGRAALATIYGSDVSAVVADGEFQGMPVDAWLDMLGSLARRVPVLVLGSPESIGLSTTHTHFESVTWLESPSAQEIISILDGCGTLGVRHRRIMRQSIPFYSSQVALHMLRTDQVLSVLTIDASSLRKIGIELGTDVYFRVQDVLQNILFEMWGASGSFRATDVLCRRSPHSNQYFVLLARSRSASGLPAPGTYQKLAERVRGKINNAFWDEIFRDKKTRVLPECIQRVPEISVGVATAMYNPCVDPMESLETMIDASTEDSRVNLQVVRTRLRETMQTLIHTDGMLSPNYQGIFRLQGMTKTKIEEARATKSLKPLRDHIFGFESLIRVRQPTAEEAGRVEEWADIINPKHLRPDVLFDLAKQAKVALELDQSCLQHASRGARNLPGVLMVNMLPRNLYFIERLQHLLSGRQNVIFEVSESEAIRNFELMLQVRQNLAKRHQMIATDDFGKGYAGLERTIRIRPDVLKFDRDLVDGIHKDQAKAAYVSGLVKAAQHAGSLVAAEGIEEWEDAELLQKMGVDLLQGYLCHRPQPYQTIADDLGLEETASVNSTNSQPNAA